MKIAVVTGGAKGIGKAISKKLAIDGFKVIVNYNSSKEKAKLLYEEILNLGYEIDLMKADLSKCDEAKKFITNVIQKYNSIDVLVNNAGISIDGLFTDVSDEDWDNVINTNLRSAFICSREAVKTMIWNKNGKIINISSMWGITGASCEVVYSISKAGIIGLTKSLAKEVGPSNIQVNAVAPGVIMTDMMNGYTKEDIEDLKERTPLMKIGTTEDVANAVAFLASKKADFITGEILNVNGGFMI